jgi:hypothetical protein
MEENGIISESRAHTREHHALKNLESCASNGQFNPRTLNLGLHKLRDITTITTPPPGRLPIITEVRKYSDALVREAIQKEIGRGGQVYFLHNRYGHD